MADAGYFTAAMDADFARCVDWLCGVDDRAYWLTEELSGFRAGWSAVQRLAALGVPLDLLGVLSGAGDLGAARVSLSPDGTRYEPEGPDPRLLVGVREQGSLVDVVALASNDPDQWALRTGFGWCLGYDAWLRCETGLRSARSNTPRAGSRPRSPATAPS